VSARDAARGLARRLWRTRLPGTGVYVVIAAAGLALHVAAAQDLFSWLHRLLAWVLLCLALVGSWGYARAPHTIAPILPLVLFQLYLMYGFAQLTQTSVKLVSGHYIPPTSAVTSAMLVAVAVAIAFGGAFTWGARHAGAAARWLIGVYPDPTVSWRPVVVALAAASATAGMLQALRPEALPAAARQIAHVVLNPYLALGLALLFRHRWRTRAIDASVWLLVATLWLSALLSSMLEAGIVSLYMLFAARWMWGRELQLRWLVIAIAGLLLLNPAKYGYRQDLREYDDADTFDSVSGRLALLGERVTQVWSDQPQEENLQTSADRASALLLLAQAIDWVPGLVPYREGEGWLPALLFVVPRGLWTDKPEISDLANNPYAIDFQLATSEGLQTTTIGIWQPIDGYWQLGYAGAVVGVGAYGMLLGWLFGRPGASTVRQLLGLYFTAEFFQILTSLQNIVASLPTVLVGAWIALMIPRVVAGWQPRVTS
jgi:hypothetical protein